MATVNRPTDVKKRDANIDQKLQLFGIYNGFKTKKLPSNEQIDVALNSFLESKALKSPSAKLSDDGKGLVGDSREVVRLMKYLFLSKNEDNLLQDFIWQTEQFDPKSIQGPGTPVDKKTAQQQGNEALEGIRTLGKLMITNGQFRKLIKDFTIIFRDVAGDAASNAAGRVRPSQDELNQIDLPAEDNTWHEAPNLSKDDLKGRMKGLYGGKAKEDAKEAVDAAAASAQPGDKTKPSGEKAKAGAGTAKNKLKEKYDENVSEEQKEKIRARNEDYKRRVKDYYNKKMPQERKDQTIWRLKKMILECQHHSDYKRAVQTLLDLAEEYGRHGRNMAKDGSGTVKSTRTNLQKATDDLKTIMERYANGTSSDPLWNQMENLANSAREDAELRNWFKSMDNYIRRCLLEEGFVLDEASNSDWDRLYEQGRYLLRDKYRGTTDKIIDEAMFFLDQFDQDPQNKEFGLAVQQLFTHLGQDQDGKPAFKSHLVKDLTDVIIPAFIENVQYIPVPRIEYQDPQIDLVVENLIFEADNLFPNIVEITSNNYFKMGRKKNPNSNNQMFDVKMAGIQLDLRDVSYYVKRKKGFPSIEDMGKMNVNLSGNGLSFEMKVGTAQKNDPEHLFKCDKVDVDIRHLKVHLVESKYKMPFNLIQPILIKVMRPVITKVVEKVLKQQFRKWDGAAWDIKQDAKRTLDESRTVEGGKKPNMYTRYFDSMKKYMENQKEQQKKQAADKAADKKVNIAYTMHDSIFPNVKLPGATSEKATKYKDMAAQGDKWQSPVFSIGKASQSKDIPRAPRIQDKAHEKTSYTESRRMNAAAKKNNNNGSLNKPTDHVLDDVPYNVGLNKQVGNGGGMLGANVADGGIAKPSAGHVGNGGGMLGADGGAAKPTAGQVGNGGQYGQTTPLVI